MPENASTRARTPGTIKTSPPATPQWAYEWPSCTSGNTPGVLTDEPLGAVWSSGSSGYTPLRQSQSSIEVAIVDPQLLLELLKDAAPKASKYAPDAKEALDITKLLKQVDINAPYYVKVINGKEYVILKGYPGLRTKLTGTKYLKSNTKLIGAVLTPNDAIAKFRGKGGVWLNVICAVGEVAVEAVMKDTIKDARWYAEITAKLAYNVTGAVIGAAVGTAAAAAFTAGSIGSSLLLGGAMVLAGPVVLGLVVGIAVGYLFDYLNEEFGLVDTLTDAIESYYKSVTLSIDTSKREVNWFMFELERNLMRLPYMIPH